MEYVSKPSMRKFECGECKGEPDCPMLDDIIWDAISRTEPKAILCLNCVERRLGRQVERVDLLPCMGSRQLVRFAERAKAGLF